MTRRRKKTSQRGSGGSTAANSVSSDGESSTGSRVSKRAHVMPATSQGQSALTAGADCESSGSAVGFCVPRCSPRRKSTRGAEKSSTVGGVASSGSPSGTVSAVGAAGGASVGKGVSLADEIRAAGASGAAAVVSPLAGVSGAGLSKLGRAPASTDGLADVSAVFGRARSVGRKLVSDLLGINLPKEILSRVLAYSSEYETLIVELLAQNERLRGRLDVSVRGAGSSAVRPAGPTAASTFVPPGPVAFATAESASGCTSIAKPVAQPVETWSLVVRGRQGQSAKDVVSKVASEVGPTLKERVHEIRALRNGGAVIRTPSVTERDSISKNAKFGEAGLTVTVPDSSAARVVVQGVDTKLTPDEFMGDVFEKNLKGKLTLDQFKSGVRLISRPWDSTKSGATNVVLEGPASAVEPLLASRRCYVKWFSFRVRPFDLVPSCYRCLSFDHFVRECRWKESACARCGQQGHSVRDCVNAIHCRNCAFQGRPSGHRMMSEDCPLYCVMLARARAKH